MCVFQSHEGVRQIKAGVKLVELNESKEAVEILLRDNETIEMQEEQMRMTAMDDERNHFYSLFVAFHTGVLIC